MISFTVCERAIGIRDHYNKCYLINITRTGDGISVSGGMERQLKNKRKPKKIKIGVLDAIVKLQTLGDIIE